MSAARINAVYSALMAVAAAAAPSRVVTDAYQAFDARPQAQLLQGVITILFAGVPAYDAENSGSLDGIDHDQTGFAQLEFTVVGQMLVAENATGTQVAAAEIALLGDIEKIANQALANDDLVQLRIISASCSQQMESPYLWVATKFQTRTDGE
jgi:hypothetical protein